MNHPQTEKRRLRLGNPWWWLVAFIFGGVSWMMWEINAYNNAVREAETAGFDWISTDTLSLIRQGWRNAFKKETWGKSVRILGMGEVRDLGRYRGMIHRLRPTIFSVSGCENVDALKGLTSLEGIYLYGCSALQNVDSLKGLTSLQTLRLYECRNIPRRGLARIVRCFAEGRDPSPRLGTGVKTHPSSHPANPPPGATPTAFRQSAQGCEARAALSVKFQ